MSATQLQQVMVRANGKPFRCDCGCNVFEKLEPGSYRCNSCLAEYHGETAPSSENGRNEP